MTLAKCVSPSCKMSSIINSHRPYSTGNSSQILVKKLTSQEISPMKVLTHFQKFEFRQKKNLMNLLPQVDIKDP